MALTIATVTVDVIEAESETLSGWVYEVLILVNFSIGTLARFSGNKCKSCPSRHANFIGIKCT